MCTDNAAMIAATGWHRLRSDGTDAPRRRRHTQLSPPLHRLTTARGLSGPDPKDRLGLSGPDPKDRPGLSGPDPERPAGARYRGGGHVVQDRPVRALRSRRARPHGGRHERAVRTMWAVGAGPRVRQRDGHGTARWCMHAKTDRMISFAPTSIAQPAALRSDPRGDVQRPSPSSATVGRVDHIDINFGCPAAKSHGVVGDRSAGSSRAVARDPASRRVERVPLRLSRDREVPYGLVRRLLTHPSVRCAPRRGVRVDCAARANVQQHYSGDARWNAIAGA